MALAFESLGAFSVHLLQSQARVFERLEHGLERVLAQIQFDSRRMFGSYHGAAGGFPGWPTLAPATQAQRVRLGFMPNLPLHRTGELQMAVDRARQGLDGVVGVRGGNLHSAYRDGSGVVDMGRLAAFHEMGTSRMPPRPFLGPAAFRNMDYLQRQCGWSVVQGLTTGGARYAITNEFLTPN